MSSEISLLRSEVSAVRVQLSSVQSAVDALGVKFGLFLEANRSSSNSGTKFVCPLECGAEFLKVSNCVIPHVLQCLLS